jgi:hypothetical protein
VDTSPPQQTGVPTPIYECPFLARNISSKGNDDLTELAAVLQIAVHFHYIVKLECTIDDRLERA